MVYPPDLRVAMSSSRRCSAEPMAEDARLIARLRIERACVIGTTPVHVGLPSNSQESVVSTPLGQRMTSSAVSRCCKRQARPPHNAESRHRTKAYGYGDAWANGRRPPGGLPWQHVSLVTPSTRR